MNVHGDAEIQCKREMKTFHREELLSTEIELFF